MSIRMQIISSLILFVFGILFVIWLNVAIPPEAIMVFLFPYTFLPIIIEFFVIPLFSFLFIAYLFWRRVKGVRSVWFFLGASLTSLVYAGQSMVQIAILYYLNVGKWLPLQIEGYSFPAIYTFKLFRSVFFTTFFSIVGYSLDVLNRSDIVTQTRLVLKVITWIHQQLKKRQKSSNLEGS